MNQKSFLDQLERGLQDLPRDAISEILSDYTEYFHDALSDGRSEQEIAAALGDPRRLARELKVQMHYRTWERERNVSSLMRTIGAIAGLGVLNFILAVPFMFYLCLLTCFMAVSVICSITGLIMVLMWGSHTATGWPSLQTANLGPDDGYVNITAFQPDSDDSSKTAKEAADARRKEMGSATSALHYHMPDIEVELRDGDQIKLTSRKGEVVALKSEHGHLQRADGGKLEDDDSYSMRRREIGKLNVVTADGDTVQIERDAKTGHIDWFSMDHAGVASAIVVPKRADDTVQLVMDDDDDFHVMTRASTPKKVLGFGLALLVGGVVCFILLLWLVRITWRGTVSFVRWQFGRIQDARTA
ncbi:DUF1700 domain-containing protein [Amantichitinum ursilacus]|uniref:DUF1700 domain-containing protein n=1 Tax=Amantichitinum ursilacus TaxID=857265 RepID=A0A0N0GM22_9NEIS|nr:DUF1700 domain-containing protein [Amantichitinum ursilacus]KPC50507.1 hypothetical protein WG78_16920 [Amantichitinum ursilacus]